MKKENTVSIEALLSNKNFNKRRDITQEQRDKLMHFNTPRYWHCFYDPNSGKLYDEYCYLIMEDATPYLIECGLIDKNRNKIGYFLNDDGTIE